MKKKKRFTDKDVTFVKLQSLKSEQHMSKIVAAMDVSGTEIIGNYKFISIVISTIENLNLIIKRLSNKQIDMNAPKNNKKREKIASELKFDNKNSVAFYCRIDRDVIINRFKERRIKRKRGTPTKKIIRAFNFGLFKQLRGDIEKFSIKHDCGLDDISFECDGDCLGFVKESGLHPTDPKEMHVLSDVVAWLNNNDKDLGGIIVRDLRDILERYVRDAEK